MSSLGRHQCEVMAEQDYCPHDDFNDPKLIHVTVTEPGGSVTRYRLDPGATSFETRRPEHDEEFFLLGSIPDTPPTLTLSGRAVPDRDGHYLIYQEARK